MTRIDDPIVRRTLVNEIEHLAALWAAQADQERGRQRHSAADLAAGKAMVLHQVAADIEQAT